MALVLKTHLDLLVVMPTGHKKSTLFMIPPMVTNCIVIMVVSFVILFNGHKIDAKRVGLQHVIFNIDVIKLKDLLTTSFVLVEHVTTHGLSNLQTHWPIFKIFITLLWTKFIFCYQISDRL